MSQSKALDGSLNSRFLPAGCELRLEHQIDYIEMDFSKYSATQVYNFINYIFKFTSGNEYMFLRYLDDGKCSLRMRPDVLSVKIKSWKKWPSNRTQKDIDLETEMLNSSERKQAIDELENAITYLALLGIHAEVGRLDDLTPEFSFSPSPETLSKTLIEWNKEWEAYYAH